MIALSLLLSVAALGLLVAGLVVGSPEMIWASIGASLSAGVVLVLEVRRRRGSAE
ncbi:hypothetical protein BH20ACT5_BH20ACT5_06390 [soil metagenome]